MKTVVVPHSRWGKRRRLFLVWVWQKGLSNSCSNLCIHTESRLHVIWTYQSVCCSPLSWSLDWMRQTPCATFETPAVSHKSYSTEQHDTNWQCTTRMFMLAHSKVQHELEEDLRNWWNIIEKLSIMHRLTISFWVRVPVLSVSRYSTRPNSSGMVLLRTTVPGMALSRWIIHEYTIFPMSRLTRRLVEKS